MIRWLALLLAACWCACASGTGGRETLPVQAMEPLSGPVTEDMRVLAPYGDGEYYFVGVVSAVRPEGEVEVLFLDGDRSVVPAASLRQETIGPGSPVHAYVDQRQGWYSGQVRERRGDRVRVSLDEGDDEWVPLSLVRLAAPEGARTPSEEPLPIRPMEPISGSVTVGMRVLAPFRTGEYYFVGNVRALQPGGQVEVLFLDGDVGVVPAAALRQEGVGPGTMVHAVAASREGWAPGQVRERQGDRVRVAFDDGLVEWVPLTSVRIAAPPGGTDAPTLPLPIRPMEPISGSVTEGMRVLAPFGGEAYYYVGIVRALRPDGEVEVLFLDGDQGVVPAAALREESIGPGTVVRARVEGREGWQSGQVLERQADRVRVSLAGGTAEWVPLTNICLAAPPTRRDPPAP